MMFRFEVFVDDKKLAYVLWALTGHCLQISVPQPVINAKASKAGIHARTNGSVSAMFSEHLKAKNIKTFGPKDIRAFCVSHGLASHSYSNVLNKVVESGVVKRTKLRSRGKGTPRYTYEVM
jgi:hypothetical protein